MAGMSCNRHRCNTGFNGRAGRRRSRYVRLGLIPVVRKAAGTEGQGTRRIADSMRLPKPGGSTHLVFV